MPVIRTPDERFATLPSFPFEPHYVEVKGLRVHYVDEGRRGSPAYPGLHGPKAARLNAGLVAQS